MMIKHQHYILLLILISFTSTAEVMTTLENEDICKQEYIQKIFNLQVQYSNPQNSVQVRRTAERSIDRSREMYSDTNSFCSALNYLSNDISDKLLNDFNQAKTGESQFR